MPLVYLFGPDGSGKSSLAQALVKTHKAQGIPVRLSWMRGTHTIASILAHTLHNFAAFQGKDNPNYNLTIPPKMRRPWQLVELTSLLPVLLERYILPSLLGYTVIGERYLPDFIVWVTLTTKDAHYPKSFTARFLLALSKTPQKTYITASPTKLLERRNDTQPTFLRNQLKLYKHLAQLLNAPTLDTTQRTVEESTKLLLKLINPTE